MSFLPKEKFISAMRKIFHKASKPNKREPIDEVNVHKARSPAKKSRR